MIWQDVVSSDDDDGGSAGGDDGNDDDTRNSSKVDEGESDDSREVIEESDSSEDEVGGILLVSTNRMFTILDLNNISSLSVSFFGGQNQVAPRNTVGSVPLEWYKDEEHIGYNLAGKKIKKKERQNKLDSFLASADDSKSWWVHKFNRYLSLSFD